VPARRAVLAVLVLVSVGCADEPAPPTVAGDRPTVDVPADGCPEPSPASPGTTTLTVETGEGEREYFLTVPEAYEGSEPAPVLLNLHGLESSADEQLAYADLEDAVDERGFVVVSPEGGGTPSRWRLPDSDGAGDDVAFVEAVLADVSERLCVDLDRVFAAGMSNGAAFSAVLACELAPRIAGVAAVAGVNLVAPCPADAPVPLIAFHGTEDHVVPYDGGSVLLGLAEAMEATEAVAAWADRNGCGAGPEEERVSPEVRRLAYDDCDDDATVELYVVEDGGHTWPGARHVDHLGYVTDDIDASALILDRFEEH
jgi:polyhydroxybutyrate depolymerase